MHETIGHYYQHYYYYQRIRGYFCNEMHYINLRFTYLLTYLLTD